MTIFKFIQGASTVSLPLALLSLSCAAWYFVKRRFSLLNNVAARPSNTKGMPSTTASGWHYSVKNAPIVQISDHDMFTNPRAAYEQALAKFGPVIGVLRKGRMEYIVNEDLTWEVLTNDDVFSFREGYAKLLNFHWVHSFFSTFFNDQDDLVRSGIVPQMHAIVDRVSGIFLKRMAESIERSCPLDIFKHAHHTISEATLVVILGERLVNGKNLAVVEQVDMDLSELTGIYQNISWWARTFPTLWHLVTWIRVLSSIIFGFLPIFGPIIWNAITTEIANSTESLGDRDEEGDAIKYGQVTVLQYLSRRCTSSTSLIGKLKSSLWMLYLLLGILLASVHQSASVSAWVVCELAARPEYLSDLRDELDTLAPVDPFTGHPTITYDALHRASRLDSFIREVFRTKGDTISTCRLSTRDTELAGIRIPKGHLVIPLASLSHLNPKYHGADAETFNGNRWCQQDDQKPAVMGSPSYFPFGLGRWACPGRVLAVAEIKMIVWSIIGRATPSLEGGSYRVVDPLNVTAVAPEARIILQPVV